MCRNIQHAMQLYAASHFSDLLRLSAGRGFNPQERYVCMNPVFQVFGGAIVPSSSIKVRWKELG